MVMDSQAAGIGRLDKDRLKGLARGRWGEIIPHLTGVDPKLLDGKHHPCPRCGGRDRFRAFDDFAETGGVMCNQCFSERNRDGLAALRWFNVESLPAACNRLADYLDLGADKPKRTRQVVDRPASCATRRPVAPACIGSAGKQPGQAFGTADEAIAALEQGRGPAIRWDYHDAVGKHVGCTLRWDRPDGSKDIRPVSLYDDGWRCAAMPTPRPLYCLSEILTAGRIYVCEGEKAADAARSIGLVATTSAGGSSAASKSDWSPVAGKDVVILPDNDAPGQKYANDVAGLLQSLSPPPTVRRVELPGLPDRGDVDDWIERHDAAEPEDLRRQIEAMATASEATTDDSFRFKALSCRELDAADVNVEFLVDGTLVAGQPCIFGGSKKTLKTTLLAALAISLASGKEFLGNLRVLRCARVMFMSGESGIGTLQETARRVAASAGLSLPDVDRLHWCDQLPQFTNLDHHNALEVLLKEKGIEVLIIDPAYLCMSGEGAENLFKQGTTLRQFNQVCQRHGVTLVIAHHTKRGTGPDPYRPPELEDIAWAGFQEWCRQWILVGRREQYKPGTGSHHLWLNVGGSVGHSALWALDVEEGTLPNRRWEVAVMHADEARCCVVDRQEAAKEQRKREQIDCNRFTIVKAMRKLPDRQGTKTDIRTMSGLSGQVFNAAFSSLIDDDTALPVEVTKTNGQTYPGFKLKDESDD